MTLDDLKPFIDWMQANPHWAGFATFLISTAESLAVVGLLIPGTIVMGAIGSLVGSGVLPSLDIILWASAGAIVGDGISYWLGYHYHGHIREMWPFRSMPNLMQKGESFFLKHGGKSVFMGRFLGPIRPIIPVIAGMMNMPPWRFTIANVTSAFTWAPAYMLPGYLLGSISVQLAPHTATRFLVMVIIALLAIWAVYWLAKHSIVLLMRWMNKGIAKLWFIIRNHHNYQSLYLALRDPVETKNHSQLALLLTSIFATVCFIALCITVSLHMDIMGINKAAWHLARNLRAVQIDRIATGITLLAEIPILYTVICTTLCWLIIKRDWLTAKYWFTITVLTILLTYGLQIIFKIPRPEGLQQHLLGWSYPSFHTTLSTVVYGFLAIIIARHTKRHYRWYLFFTAVLVSLITFSRIYLGAAWISDIVGGLLLGTVLILFFSLSYRHKAISKLRSGQLVIITLLAIFIPWIMYGYLYFQQTENSYLPHQPTISIAQLSWWNLQQPQLLYRHNYIGKPVELLNLQWASNLETIKQTLIQQGWRIIAKPNLATILNRIAAKNREEQLPVFPHLYHHNPPALIMIKYFPEKKRMLVLRLWDAHLIVTESNLPLWLGTIAYHKPWKIHFPHRPNNDIDSDNYLAAMQQLMNDIPGFNIKKLPVPLSICKGLRMGCSPNILLVQPIKEEG